MLLAPTSDRDQTQAGPDQQLSNRVEADQTGSTVDLPTPSDQDPVEALAVPQPSDDEVPGPVLVVEVPTTATTATSASAAEPSTADDAADQTTASTPVESETPVTDGPVAQAETSEPPPTEPTSTQPAVADTETTEPQASEEPTTTGQSQTTQAPSTITQPPTTKPPATEQPPTTEPPTTAKPQPTGAIKPCSDPVTIEMTVASSGSAMGQAVGKPCVVIEMQPGSYPSISVSGLQQVTMRCAESDGCAASRIVVSRVEQLIVEGLRFTGGHDYGIMVYETERLLVRDNQFINASNGHDISLKNLVGYTEILDNTFIECTRHCLELGQNGNIRTRPSTSGVAVVRGNRFERPLINAITQRALCTLVVEDNEFIDVAGWAVQTWPYWAKYPFGRSGDDGTLYVPKCPMPRDQVNGETGPMRTTISNNSFSGNARMGFEGRGVIDDTVEVTGNSGSFTCRFVPMAGRTQSATADEETAAAPTLAPGSQC